jgi:hypothetical protein
LTTAFGAVESSQLPEVLEGGLRTEQAYAVQVRARVLRGLSPVAGTEDENMGIWRKLLGRKSDMPLDIVRELASPSVKFPYETIIVAGQEAVSTCVLLRTMGSGHFTPVILGSPSELAMLIEGFELSDATPEKMISLAAGISMDSFSKKRMEQEEEYYGNVDVGSWPVDPHPSQKLTGHTDILTRKPLKDVVLCKIPTPRSWEVPAYLQFGAWNDCPAPEEHVAVLRCWNEKYGADLITLTHDIIECTVSRPPTTEEGAMELAREQFIYCSDIVYQGTESLSALAATLLNGKTWYFWWD